MFVGLKQILPNVLRRNSNVLKLHSSVIDIWNHYLTDIQPRPSALCAITRSHVRSRLQTMPKRRHDDNSIVQKPKLKKHSEMGAVLSLCSCFKSSDQAEKSTSDVTENTGLLSEKLARSYEEKTTKHQGSACEQESGATDLHAKAQSDQHVDITYGVTSDIKEIKCSLNDQKGAIKRDEFQNLEEKNCERDAEVQDEAAYLKKYVTVDKEWNDYRSHQEADFDGGAEMVSSQDNTSRKTELLSAQDDNSGKRELLSAQDDNSGKTELLSAQVDNSGKRELLSAQGDNSGKRELLSAQGDNSGKRELLSAQGDNSGKRELLSAQGDNSGKRELLSAQGAPCGQTELVSAQGDVSERKELVFAQGDSSGQTEMVSVQGNISELTEMDYTSGQTITDCTNDDLTRQTESISSQIDAETKKPTVLPKQLLDSITSNVSERCNSDDSWMQTIGLQDHDLSDTEVFGSQMATDTHVSGEGKTVSEKKDGMKKVKEEKVAKPRPNYFIAIKVTNPKIHIGLGEVQEAVLNVEPRMKEIMIALPTLHLTLYVTHLPDDESIDRATAALEEAGEELRPSFQTGCPTCQVSGLGTFRNQVVFAKILPGEALDQLAHIHDVVKKKMTEHGLESTDNSTLIPHITLMKMSKVRGRFRKSVAKKIDPDLYKKFKDMTFGEEVINTLQLCSMVKQKDVFGYYQVLHKVDLNSEETTVSKFCEGLVQSALVSAMETVSKDLQKDCSSDKQKEKSTKARKRKPRKKTS